MSKVKKMKKIIWLSSLILASINMKAQDLIVTKNNDSINCHIDKVKEDYIYFTFRNNEDIEKTLISQKDVQEYKLKFYDEKKYLEKPIRIASEDFTHWRFAIQGGYSYHTSKLDKNILPEFRDYAEELRSGLHFSADGTYFFSKNIGVGLICSFFHSENSMPNIYVKDKFGNKTYGELKDNINILFIAPSFVYRYLHNKDKNTFIYKAGIGYSRYSNESVIVNSYELAGNSLGMLFDLGYEISLSEKIAVGIEVGYLFGNLSKLTIGDGKKKVTKKFEKDELMSLNRLDFSVGLRFNI